MSPNITNSTTVDERIVEMRIDNSKFEDGAKKTIGILEKLDKALHLHAETDEIDKLNNAIGKFDVSPMASGLDSLQSHFSALEIMGMRVISNLTDSVYNFTTRTIKSLSIDQVTAGWSKYEEKTSAVQTIMAATRKDIGTLYADEADQMAAVNEQMEKLNWFTDETSYSFLDMVNNIGKFTSNGRALDESVTAMMGISTWAAISGAKVQEAGRAMYNLSQALGTGSVQVRDWMSIENANMATYEFKQMAIETAEELGTLRKVSDGVWESLAGHEVTIESFRENLKDDWFTSDVLLDTLQNYGSFTEALKIATDETDTTATEFLRAMERYEAGEEINKDLIPWVKELSKAEYDLGRRAFQAAQEAKTFTEAIDATKDAVSTGWMNTFEIIFGDYKTAKGFWTDVANDLWDIFAGGGESRNEMLEIAFGKTVKKVNHTVDELGHAIEDNLDASRVEQINSAWQKLDDAISKTIGETSFKTELNSWLGQITSETSLSLDQLIEKYGSLKNAFLSDDNNIRFTDLEAAFYKAGYYISDYRNELDELLKISPRLEDQIYRLAGAYGRDQFWYDIFPSDINNSKYGWHEYEKLIRDGTLSFEQFEKAIDSIYSIDWTKIEKDLEASGQSLEDFKRILLEEYGSNFNLNDDRPVQELIDWLGYTDHDAKIVPKILNRLGLSIDDYKKKVEGLNAEELYYNVLNETIENKNPWKKVKDYYEEVIDRGGLFRQSLVNILDHIIEIKEIFGEAFDNAFGSAIERGEVLGQIIEKFYSITEKLSFDNAEREEARTGLVNLFEIIFKVIRVGIRVASLAIKLGSRLGNVIFKVIDKLLGAFSRLSETSIFKSIDNIIDALSMFIDIFMNFLDSVIDSESVNSFFIVLGDIFANIGKWLSGAKGYVQELISFLEPAIGLLATAAAGITGWAFMSALNLIISAVSHIESAYNKLTNWASESTILQTIWTNILSTITKISDAIKWGWNYVKDAIKNNGFSGAIASFWEWIKAISKVQFPKLSGLFEAIGNMVSQISASLGSKLTFDSIPDAFNSIVSILGNGLTGLGGLITIIFGGFLTLITGIIQGLQGINFDTQKITDSFNKFYDIIKLVFNGLFGDPTEFRERITNFVMEAWSGFKDALEQISFRDVIKALRLSFLFAIGAKIMSVLSMVKKIGEEAASIPESISWSIKRGGKLLDDIGKSFQANAIIKMAAAVIMVSMALYGLSRINEDKLTHAAAVISVVMIILTMLVNSTRKSSMLKNVDIKKFQVFGTVGSALIGLGVAIAAFTYAVFKIANAENPKRLIGAALAIIAFIGIIATIIGVFAVNLVKSNANWDRLKNIGMIISRLSGAFFAIAVSVGMLALPVIAFTLAAGILEKNGLSSGSVWWAAIAVMGLILMLGAAIKMIMDSMANLDNNQIRNTGSALLKIAGSVFVFAIAINTFTLPFFALAAACMIVYHYTQSLAPIWQALGMFGLIFAGIAGFFLVLSLILSKKTMNPVRIKALGQAMLKISGSVALVAIGIKKMVNAFLSILVVLAVLKKFDLSIDFKTAGITLAAIAGGLLAIVAILVGLSAIKGISAKRLLSLAAVITALGIAFLFIAPAIIGLGAVISILIYFASSLKNFDDIVSNMSKISWTLVKIAGAALLLGTALTLAGIGLVAGSASLLLISVGIYAIASAIDKLATNQDVIFKFFKALRGYFTIDNLWLFTKMAIVIAGVTIALLLLTKRVGQFISAWKLLSTGGSISEKLSSTLGKFGQNIPTLLHGAFTKAVGYLSAHAEDIIPALGVIITIIGGYITGLIPTLSTQLVAAVVTLIKSLASELKSNKDILIDSLASIANTIFDVFSEVLQKVFIDGYKDRNFFGKLMTWILGSMGGIAGLKLVAAVLNVIFAGSRLGTLFNGKKGNGVTSIGGKAGAVFNVGSAVINVAKGGVGPGGNGGAKITPFPNTPPTTGEIIKEIPKVAGGIVAPFAMQIGGILLATKGLEKLVHNKIYKDAFDGLGNTVDDGVTAIGRINTDIEALKTEVQNLSKLTEDEKKLAIDQYKWMEPNATDEEIAQYLEIEESNKLKANFDKIDQLNIKIRQHQEVLDGIYESIAESLGVSKEKLLESISKFDNIEDALEDVQLSKLAKVLKTISGTGVKEDAINAMLDMGKMLSTDENLKGILNTNLQSAGLGQNLDETIGHLLSGQASIPAVQAALIVTLTQAYNDPALHDQVADILKRSGLSEDLNTALKELGLEAVKNSQYTQSFVQAITDIANNPEVKAQIETKYPEVGQFIGNAISGSISKDDISAKLVMELAALSHDPELMQAINASCPEFGQFISSVIAQNIQKNDIAVGLVETLREAMGKPEIRNDIMTRYPELGKLITDSVAGSISKDDLSPEILTQLTAITHDPQVLADINAAYPELGKQITNAILDGITIDDLAKNIVEKVNGAYNSEITQAGLAHGSTIGATIANDLVPDNTQLAEAIQSRDWATLIDMAAQNMLPADSQYAELYGAYKDIAGAIPEGGAAGIVDNLDIVNSALEQMGLGEADYFAQLLQINSPSKIYSDIAGSIPEGVGVGVTNKAYLAINAVSAMARTMQIPFQNIQSKFQQFGAQAVRGVVIGINNNVNAAYNAGVNLANAVNRGYTNTLKIKSPSRVFEALSMYVPMGAANGIMKGIPIAVSAASDLANAIADEAAHAMSTAAYVASDSFDFRPTLTPVVDLTNAYQGMDSLESIFADNPLSTSIRPQNAYRQMPTQATNYTFSNQNRDVVNEIHRLSDLMTQLGEEITNMKIVLNSGVLVGEMAPAMNKQLGTLASRERRQ